MITCGVFQFSGVKVKDCIEIVASSEIFAFNIRFSFEFASVG